MYDNVLSSLADNKKSSLHVGSTAVVSVLLGNPMISATIVDAEPGFVEHVSRVLGPRVREVERIEQLKGRQFDLVYIDDDGRDNSLCHIMCMLESLWVPGETTVVFESYSHAVVDCLHQNGWESVLTVQSRYPHCIAKVNAYA